MIAASCCWYTHRYISSTSVGLNLSSVGPICTEADMAPKTLSDEKIQDVKTLSEVNENAPPSPHSPEIHGGLSSFRSICLVATCTAAMIINVSQR